MNIYQINIMQIIATVHKEHIKTIVNAPNLRLNTVCVSSMIIYITFNKLTRFWAHMIYLEIGVIQQEPSRISMDCIF